MSDKKEEFLDPLNRDLHYFIQVGDNCFPQPKGTLTVGSTGTNGICLKCGFIPGFYVGDPPYNPIRTVPEECGCRKTAPPLFTTGTINLPIDFEKQAPSWTSMFSITEEQAHLFLSNVLNNATLEMFFKMLLNNKRALHNTEVAVDELYKLYPENGEPDWHTREDLKELEKIANILIAIGSNLKSKVIDGGNRFIF